MILEISLSLSWQSQTRHNDFISLLVKKIEKLRHALVVVDVIRFVRQWRTVDKDGGRTGSAKKI